MASALISRQMASASGLTASDARLVLELVDEWHRRWPRNVLRDRYYLGHVRVKDLGVSVTPAIARKLDPRVDWAAKCVDWWADRVQWEGVTCADDGDTEALASVLADNDMRNLVHKVASSALRHSCAFLAVTSGDPGLGEPATVVSGFPATAASALWDEARKRIRAGLVVVETRRRPGSPRRVPTLAYALADDRMVVLRSDGGAWSAEVVPHGMGRVPMVQVAYHPTLERPFGRSRITRTVMSLVDDAQREMMNMTAAAAFAAAPQKFLLGADKTAAEKIRDSPFAAFIGSIFAATSNGKGQVPTFGQLAQLSMQPHTEYLRDLAAQFSGSTGVPLSSLGVVSDNPSSAEAIWAGKEDAVVDIQAYVEGLKRSLADVCVMALASERQQPFGEAMASVGRPMVHFASPATPSEVSMADAMSKQISAIPWLASSDVTLRKLGYDEEQVAQLRSDRRKAEAREGATTVLGGGDADRSGGAGALP
jgi:hypothetical protein